MNEAKITLYKVVAGILVAAVLECIIGGILADNTVKFILGEFLGTVGAVIFMVNLYYSLDKALDMNEENAVKYTKKKAAFRMLLLAVVIIIAYTLWEYVSVLGTFLGLINIKIGVFMLPLLDRIKPKG